MTRPKNNPYLRTLLMAVAPALAVLALAGCDDDKIVYVDDIPPAVPTGVFTVTGNGRVDIYWNPVRESDVEGYGVYWSDQLDGTYQRLDTLYGVENTHYVDTDVQNGVTYFYAVDAFDFAGHESALSYEAAFDTPRPAGTSVSVFARLDNPNQSGIDFSDWSPSSGGPFVTAWDAPDTDVYFQNVGGVLYAKGTLIGNFWNDIQDLGWTASMDDVSWAPSNGWSVSPNGVELIEEHTYVVWTHDSYFAKLRVTTIIYAGGAPVGAIIDWAYQIDRNNPELIMPARPLDRPADDGRTS